MSAVLSQIRNRQFVLTSVLFVFAVAVAGFLVAALVYETQTFPYMELQQAKYGLKTIVRTVLKKEQDPVLRFVSEVGRTNAAEHRVAYPENVTGTLLWPGGEGLFSDLCPERGCLAVEYGPGGEVLRTVPYRFDELTSWDKIVNTRRSVGETLFVEEHLMPLHSMDMYRNGDLLVTYWYRNTIPWVGGVARIDRNGNPKWVRHDYSHHWPTVVHGPLGEELALVPNITLDESPLVVPIGGEVTETIRCDFITQPNLVDHVKLLDGDGMVLQDIRIVDRILESPYAAHLVQTREACDVLHLNYIDTIRPDVQLPGVKPGDYVVSLRNLSAFGILDSETGELKRFVRGTFHMQHSVQHLRGSEFLLFDNQGGDPSGGPSRVLLVDLSDEGVKERTVYPRPETPDELRIFSEIRGHLSISGDRERVIVTPSDQGMALEVRISDGSVLNVFRNLHDVSGIERYADRAGDMAAQILLQQIDYLD